MTNDPSTEGGALIRIKVVATKFATGDPTYRMNKVGAIEVLKPVLVRVMGVGSTIEIVGRRIFPTFLITCIL